MEPLRILHVTPFYQEAWAYGGIPRAVCALAQAQCARGHQVTVVTTDAHLAEQRLAPSPSQPLRGARAAVGGQGGPEVHVFGNLSNRLAFGLQLFLPIGLRGFLRQHVADFHVAHLHAHHNLLTSLAARACRGADVPYVLQTHGTAPLIERRRLAKWAFDRIASRGVLAGAAAFIAVSSAEAKQLRGLGIREQDIHIIPCGLDLAEFQGVTRGRLRAELGLTDEPLVAFLGKLTPRKRVERLVEAFAGLARARARLLIAGPDMGSGKAVRRLVARLGLGERVFFFDTLSGPARLQTLADADVVAYPAQNEVLGLVPLEALLCGTPVVVADDSGCGEMIGEVGGGRVVEAGASHTLTAALDEILADAGTWRARAATAQIRVRERFASGAIAAQVEAAYAQVVAGPVTRERA